VHAAKIRSKRYFFIVLGFRLTKMHYKVGVAKRLVRKPPIFMAISSKNLGETTLQLAFE
jgi:hypothetical protein